MIQINIVVVDNWIIKTKMRYTKLITGPQKLHFKEQVLTHEIIYIPVCMYEPKWLLTSSISHYRTKASTKWITYINRMKEIR